MTLFLTDLVFIAHALCNACTTSTGWDCTEEQSFKRIKQ